MQRKLIADGESESSESSESSSDGDGRPPKIKRARGSAKSLAILESVGLQHDMVEACTKRIKLGDKTVSEISWFDKIMPAVCMVCQLEDFRASAKELEHAKPVVNVCIVVNAK